MKPGPTYIFQCTVCRRFMRRGSLLSASSFFRKLYSDGKIVDDIPKFPKMTRCKVCQSFMWLTESEVVGKYNGVPVDNPDWQSADRAEFLTLTDYFDALKITSADSLEDLYFIRYQIWQGYNDRARREEPMFEKETDEARWAENCKALLALCDPENNEQKIVITELYRNLGEFDQCLAILKTIDDPNLNWIVDRLTDACHRKYRWVERIA